MIFHFHFFLPEQNAALIRKRILKCIFMSVIFFSLIQISLKFVLKGPVNNTSVLVQVMAWRHTDDKVSPEPLTT